MMRRQRTFGMSFRDRQAITVNVERQTYKEIQDLLRQERMTMSELLHSFFISKLESCNKNDTITST
jgi:hypothetical protein